ncbi:MAG TPA: phosphate ABC transporter substrate-binding protein PstS [Acidobacteriaceae bacterium]|jgi:phosphate transport system substrate-binding protein|nr:phosphate ABC transporter substrate-binding protein PstS [Acidobacteriaceae bacterium]
MSNRFWAALLAVGVLGTLSACNSSNSGSSNVVLSGAGSTFVNPAMSRWTADFSQAHPNIHINYQSIGSGGGIQQVKAGTVDFGASDVALKDAQLAGMSPVVQIPETAGPVCITYNLPGLTQPLRLSPQALAGLFLGTIKTWKDPQLAKDNPGVKLPSSPVIISHRSDGSGTTGIFTEYLSSISPEWKQKVGSGTAVSWPTGIGGKGSEGVTGNIRNSPGAIGYVELSYAQQNNLPTVLVGNQAGKYVAPTAAGTTADIAAFADQISKDPRDPIVNPPASAPDAYPISGLTFLIIPKDGPDKAKRTALKQFIQYIITDGQATAGTLNYAPLPDSVKQYDQQQLQLLTAAGQPIS